MHTIVDKSDTKKTSTNLENALIKVRKTSLQIGQPPLQRRLQVKKRDSNEHVDTTVKAEVVPGL